MSVKTGIWGFNSKKLRQRAVPFRGKIYNLPFFFTLYLWLRSGTPSMTIKGKGLLPLPFTLVFFGTGSTVGGHEGGLL